MYRNLTVFVGPMFSGKTENLVKEALFRSFFEQEPRPRLLAIKPAMDTRYADGEIVSHDGARIAAQPVSDLGEIDLTRFDYVFIDEAQFFESPFVAGDLVSEVRRAALAGVRVYASGLDLDYLGAPFATTASLMAMAGKIERMSARCARCGGEATYTGRREGRGARVELGSDDAYEALCHRHWRETMIDSDA